MVCSCAADCEVAPFYARGQPQSTSFFFARNLLEKPFHSVLEIHVGSAFLMIGCKRNKRIDLGAGYSKERMIK